MVPIIYHQTSIIVTHNQRSTDADGPLASVPGRDKVCDKGAGYGREKDGRSGEAELLCRRSPEKVLPLCDCLNQLSSGGSVLVDH